MSNNAEPGKNSRLVSDHPIDRLAVERTELALERTLLSWQRTVIALITSGFAIDRLVETFREKRIIAGEAIVAQAHITGLVLTITGTALTVFVTVLYMRRGKELARMKKESTVRMIPGVILSAFLFLTGLVLIYMVAVSK